MIEEYKQQRGAYLCFVLNKTADEALDIIENELYDLYVRYVAGLHVTNIWMNADGNYTLFPPAITAEGNYIQYYCVISSDNTLPLTEMNGDYPYVYLNHEDALQSLNEYENYCK